jgi:hypothetical protein
VKNLKLTHYRAGSNGSSPPAGAELIGRKIDSKAPAFCWRPARGCKRSEPTTACATRCNNECKGIIDAGLVFLAALPRLREIHMDGLPGVTHTGTRVFPAHVRVK